jgi:hypothetical protein
MDKETTRNTGQPAPEEPEENDPNTSALYIKDKETGEWKVGNPSGSMGYNYLYRDPFE